MKFQGKNGESIEVVDIDKDNLHLLGDSESSELSLLWLKSSNTIINVDTIDYAINQNQLISFTEFHTIRARELESAVLIRWNRSFYCVVDHDSEVGCKGILYYGASTLPIIKPSKDDLDILDTVYRMLCIEMRSHDSLQLEMLQMMLKRLLILCTRIYKNQESGQRITAQSINIIREYNYLVEQHFKTKHTVKEYADMLYKSPKTLSNVFKKYGETTPLRYIHNRIMLEARRMLSYTEMTISEVSDELGFVDVQTFSRFFKKQEGIPPQEFRKREV